MRSYSRAAAVLGAAADDLYAMQDYERAIANGRRLIEQYPAAEPSIRRAAWAVIAHASFDTNAYPEAEQAYGRVLALTPSDDERHQSVVDNLAAAIYQQGEQANEAEDHRAAADHFLRIAEAAPGSEIRPLAEYDAGAALIRLEAWEEAAGVLDRFRRAYPDHELNREATKQIAFIYREEGDLSRAAGEYERVAAEADDPELRREALLVAGELYEDSGAPDRALGAYRKYVQQFPEPLETAVETRFKIAEILEAQSDEAAYHDELRRIVELDRAAGAARTPRIRYLAARSALVLSEQLYHRFDEIALVQPFQQSLKEKRQRMETALDAFRALVDYEVGEVTAAATFYMAEVYFDFSRSLLESERPADLAPAELQDYELVLEEEAFPFEERAITVHEKNLELMGTGVYNRWIEKSLGRLAVLMPGRYAKSEESSGFLTSLEQYAYVAPNAPDPEAPPAELAEGAPAAPAPTPAPAAAALPGPEPESAEIVPAPVAPQDAASAEPAPERTPAPEAPQQPENVVAPPVADAVEDAEPVQDAEAPDAAEAAESETAAVVEDAEVAETAPAAPEPEVAPEQAVAPEPEVAPEQAAAPEPEIAPEQAAAPEGEIAPEQAAAPEGEIVPEQAAAAEPEIAPESEVAPEPEIAPEQAAAPEPEIAPEPAAGAEQAAVPDPAPPAEAAAPEEDAESIEIEEPMPAAPAAPADVPPAAIAPEPPQVDHATP